MGASAAKLRRRLGRTELALAGILLAGALLRIWLIHDWRPAFLGYPDSSTYIAAAGAGHDWLFYNPFRPAGYPMFLIALHAIYSNLTFVVVVQHLMGLATAVLLYLLRSGWQAAKWTETLLDPAPGGDMARRSTSWRAVSRRSSPASAALPAWAPA